MTLSDSQRMNEFLPYLKSKSFTKRSIEGKFISIRMFWHWLDQEGIAPEEVSYNDLLAYMKYKSRNGASQRTIQAYIGVIKHYFEHLIQEGKIIINPASEIEVKGVKRKVLYHILEPHELQALYNPYPTHTPKEIRNKVMLGLLVNQGLTTAELSRLEVKDVDLRTGEIDIKGSARSNGRKIKLEAHQIMELYDYVMRVRAEIKEINPKRKYQERQENQNLFIGDGGNSANFSNYMTRLMVKVRKMNPKVINAKHIRASVITKWLKIHNLREVQYLAGHRYISTTEGYLENEMEGLLEEVQQFHPLG